jgi:hypothetical protein
MAAQKPTIVQIAKILDPMLSDNFLFEINLPTKIIGMAIKSLNGGGGITTATEVLRLQCRTASKPGSTIEPVPVDLFGHSIQYAGRLTFSHSMSVEYVEDRRGAVTQILTAWQNLCRKVLTQSGDYKLEYTGTGILTIFDQAGLETNKYTIKNMWPSEVPDMAFDGSGANLITVSSTFTYDYYYEGENDPAAASSGGIFG